MPGFIPGIHAFFCDPARDRRSEHVGHTFFVISRSLHQLRRLSTHAERRADIRQRRGYINPPGTSGLLAFGWESENDGIDTIERRP
jgi:hypothetical protein